MVEARCEQIRAQGRSPFNEYQLPEAVLRFRQGFGRLIRHKADRGIVVVLDSRVVTKAYGKKFLQVLPDCPVHVHPADRPAKLPSTSSPKPKPLKTRSSVAPAGSAVERVTPTFPNVEASER